MLARNFFAHLLGGVREPLLNLQDGDEVIVDKVVELVETAVAKWVK